MLNASIFVKHADATVSLITTFQELRGRQSVQALERFNQSALQSVVAILK
jgi:hypothetical protein